MKKTLVVFMIVLLSVTAALAAENSRADLQNLGLSVKILEVFRAIDLTKKQAATLYEGLVDAKAKAGESIAENTQLLEKLREALINGDDEQAKRIHEALKEQAKAFVEVRNSVLTLFKENITIAQAEKFRELVMKGFIAKGETFELQIPEEMKKRIANMTPEERERVFKELKSRMEVNMKNPEELRGKFSEEMKERMAKMPPEEREKVLAAYKARLANAMKEKEGAMQKEAAFMKKELAKKIEKLIFSQVFLDTLKDYAGIE